MRCVSLLSGALFLGMERKSLLSARPFMSSASGLAQMKGSADELGTLPQQKITANTGNNKNTNKSSNRRNGTDDRSMSYLAFPSGTSCRIKSQSSYGRSPSTRYLVPRSNSPSFHRQRPRSPHRPGSPLRRCPRAAVQATASLRNRPWWLGRRGEEEQCTQMNSRVTGGCFKIERLRCYLRPQRPL